MATTKFSVITTGDKPSFHICVKELPGEHTYKVAVTVAKALTQEIEGEQIIAVAGIVTGKHLHYRDWEALTLS